MISLKYLAGLLVLFTLVIYTKAGKTKNLDLVREWKDLEFGFPSQVDRTFALNNGLYVPGNGVPIDVDVHYNNNGSMRIFVTIPRFTTGIPFSLATISNANGENGPILEPYPHYAWHSRHGTECEGITSVFRIAIDECHRLWVLDTGRIDTLQYCPPQILVFDLLSDNLLHRYRFPQSQYKTGVSLFVTPIVDVRDPPPTGRCADTRVYIADVTGFGLIVYDAKRDVSWRIENKLMFPVPQFGTFTIAGESFDLMDGILGLSISPRARSGERYLYFHSLASSTENAVRLSLIDNQTLWEDPNANPRSFAVIGDRRVQSAAEAIDSKGNLFFGLIDPIAIGVWNSRTPYRSENIRIVARNDNTLQFASGLKIIRNRQGKEELWVLTNRFQRIMAGTKDTSEVNFRIQKCSVYNLLRNRPCGNSYNNNDNLIFT